MRRHTAYGCQSGTGMTRRSKPKKCIPGRRESKGKDRMLGKSTGLEGPIRHQ